MIKSIKYIIFIVLLCGESTCFENHCCHTVRAQEIPSATKPMDLKNPQMSLSSMQATKLLRDARLMYQSRTVISAQISEDILILDRRVVGNGSYQEKIYNEKRYLRMDMNYSNEISKFSVRYIEDGTKDLFWIVKNMEDYKEALRVDMFKLTEQTADPNLVASIDNVPITPIALGGISYTLFQLEHFYLFNKYSMETNTQTGEKFHVIEGVWNPKYFPFPKKVSKNGTIAWESVPAELPDSVKIYFDEQTLFPCRIYYYRTIQGTPALITKIHYYNVSFDVRLMPQQFSFEPPADVLPKDVTEYYLKK